MNRIIKINALKRVNVQRISQISNGSQRSNASQRSQSMTQISDEKVLENNIVIENPLRHPDFFGVHKLFTVRQLFDSRVHLGHKSGTLNEHMTQYIFGSRLGLIIFDLDKTAQLLRDALNFTAHMAFRGGVILFINRSRHTGHLVERTAKECSEFAHCREWPTGTFTDSTNFYQAVTRLPDLIIFLSTLNNVFETHPAVTDAAKLLIPSVGIVDSNSDPTLITYPVPGNDDTYSSIELFCQLFKQSILLGKTKRKEMLEKYGTIET